MNSGIYQIRNLVNGKKYFGSTNNFHLRKLRHWGNLRLNKHDNIFLQRAWNKYGEAAFVFEPLVYCAEDNLLPLEQVFLNNNVGGYNINPNADKPPSNAGKTCSEETKLKQRNAALNRSPEVNERIRQGLLGKTRSSEAKERIRQGHNTPEAIANHQRANTGKHHSIETRQKIAESHIGFTGKQHSSATKERMRQARLIYWQNRKGANAS